jgi:esterase
VSFVPAHDVFGTSHSGPVALICHGILGSRRNWRGFVRRLGEELPDWRFVLVDHRNHGESVDAPPPHTIEACAEDLEALAAHLDVRPRVVVGHSFGGKVALELAARRPVGLEQVWSLDAIPAVVPVPERATSGPLEVIASMRRVAMPQPTRRAITDSLLSLGLPASIGQWLSTNLRRVEGGFEWAVDLDAAEAMIDDYFDRDLWPVVEASDPAAPDVEIVRAGRSDRWTAPVLARFDVLPPGAVGRLHLLPDSGHWVHVDDPAGLRTLMLDHWAR